MKLGTTIFTALIAICISFANAEGTRKLSKRSKGSCDLTGMYDMLETPTFFEWGVPATDTAKISFLCFDDEDEFDDWECLLNNCRRNLKELSENAKRLGGGRNLEHSQVCYFEFLGFPDIHRRRDLKDATALDTGGRKLQPGVHNAGIAYVYEEDHPIKEGKDVCAVYFDDDDNYLDLNAYALEVRKGVLAIQSEVDPEGFPYFAFKTTGV